MIHVPRVFVSNALFEIRARPRFVSFPNFIAVHGYTGIPGRSINIDTSFFFLSLFSFIYIYTCPLASLLRVYYAIMSGREFIRANGESRCVDTEIALRANERTDARPRISRYTIRMLLYSPPLFRPVW